MDGDIKSNVMTILPATVSRRPVSAQATSVVSMEQGLPVGGRNLPESAARQETSDDEKVEEAVSNLNDYVQVIRRELQFRVDKETGQTVVTVLDSETREVIRQIPREEVLALARHLGTEKGLLFSADT